MTSNSNISSFNNNPSPSRQFLRDKILIKKKKLARKMCTEKIIEFELRGPEAPGHTFTSNTAYFHDKTKFSKANLRVNYYSLQNNIAGNNVPCFSPPRPSH